MDIKDLPQEYQDRIKRFDYFFVENTDHSFQEDDLFKYEMFVMEESLTLYEHFKDIEDFNTYLDRHRIGDVCKGKISSYKGFIFRYKKDLENIS